MIDKEMIHQAAEDIDIFEADLTKEYERLCKPKPRMISLWPLVTAACVAGIVLFFLSPPREETKTMSQPYSMSEAKGKEMWQYYYEEQSYLDAQIDYQQEVKNKGERLATYIKEQQRTIEEEY